MSGALSNGKRIVVSIILTMVSVGKRHAYLF